MKSQSSAASVLHPASCAGLDVVGLGYCSWDYLGILEDVPTFDAPTISLDDFAISGGGPVSTALVTLARLGPRTGYLGAIGDDDAGLNLRRTFEEEGVDISRLRVRPGTRSPVCICLVQAHTGKRIILCYRGTSGELDPEPPDRPYVTVARILHLDGHHMNAAITAAQWMREAGATVVLDANRPRPRLNELLPWVDVLITNSHFPAAYTGEPVLERAARKLLSTAAVSRHRYSPVGSSTPGANGAPRFWHSVPRSPLLRSAFFAEWRDVRGQMGEAGPRLVVSTLGERGCLCVTAEGQSYVPGFEVPVVDTTGAGDAFHGAFIYGLLQDWPLERTATFANAVAAMNCTALGGRGGLPRLPEVEAFLRSTGGNLSS